MKTYARMERCTEGERDVKAGTVIWGIQWAQEESFNVRPGKGGEARVSHVKKRGKIRDGYQGILI